MRQTDFTPQEAAALTGVRLQRIQNAITDRKLGRTFPMRRDGRRRIDLPAVLAMAASDRLRGMDRLRGIRIAPAALYRAFRQTGLPRAPVPIADAVAIDAPRLLAGVIDNLRLYDIAREQIISDPQVMVGLPTIKGTRLPARMIHARVKGGDSIASILADYPYLNQDLIQAAALYIEANPARGRPRRRNTPRE
jgi:uncharacterized protein (DUF433 family)